MTGIVLAGGKSKRMGKNKAFLEVQGERLLDTVVMKFKEIFGEIILVTNTPAEYLHLDLRIVTDIIPKKGALGGIYTGLFYASSQHIFVAACDVPFLNTDFIRYMISKTDNFDVVIPHPADGLQPLHAIYSKNCMKHIEGFIEAKDLKIRNLYSKVRVREVSPQEILPFDPEETLFFNINTPEDVTKAREISKERSIEG